MDSDAKDCELLLEALVIASHGQMMRLRNAAGEELLSKVRGRKLQAVCGDRVGYSCGRGPAEAVIRTVYPRRSAIFRGNLRGRGELLAANVTALVVVLAPVPSPDLFVVDRYLSAAAGAGIEALIVANKADLAWDPIVTLELTRLVALGYPLVWCSVVSGRGLPELRPLLEHQTIMLVGQSGVGKSSLVKALLPHQTVMIGELTRDRMGRHTTTTARLFPLAGGGALIDAPGVRDFAPAMEMLDGRSLGFKEAEALAPHCRFADCVHLLEPNCAVRLAAEQLTISPRRYESYRRMRRLFNDLRQVRHNSVRK